MRVRQATAVRLWRGWLVLLAATLALAGMATAHAAWQALATQPRTLVAVQAVPVRQPPAIARPVDAPIATSATGTTALPPLPMAAATAATLAAAEPGIVPAQPFALGRASALDRARALQCLADTIYYEAASEPDAGQRAVAQVVLNRVRHPAFPATVCGVVYQGSQAHGCQFSFACDGAMARIPSRGGWARAAQVAAGALAGSVYAPVGLATHYHTYAVTPAWNRSMVMTDAVGAHFFHRWKGFWGTSAAFAQRYAGGEPLPAPHAPAATTTTAALATAVAAAPTRAGIRPAYVDAGTLVPLASDDRLPPASTILPKWRDSGKPL